ECGTRTCASSDPSARETPAPMESRVPCTSMNVIVTTVCAEKAPGSTWTSTRSPRWTVVSAGPVGAPGSNIAPGTVGRRTTTPNELAPTLPARSSAVQVTIVRPYGNADPLSGRHTGVTVPSMASLAPGAVYETTVSAAAGILTSTITSAFDAMTGGFLS